MKKILTFLFAISLFSCKQDQSCYECTTTIKITIIDSEGKDTWSVSDKQSKCDVTESEIREYEIANTDSVTYTNGQARIDTVIVTTCKK